MDKQTQSKLDAYETLVILARLPWAKQKYKIDFLERLKKSFEKLANVDNA